MIVFCSDSHTAKGHVGDRQLGRAPARGRPHRRRDRAGRISPRTRRRAACRQIVADRRRRRRRRGRPRRLWPRRSERPSRRWPTRTPTCWSSTRVAEAEQGRDLAQLLRIAPDRDRHLLGARGAARRDAVSSAGPPPERSPRQRPSGVAGRRTGAARRGGPRAPQRSGRAARSRQQVARERFERGRARRRRGGRPARSTASVSRRLRAARCGAGRSRNGTVSWRGCRPP